MGMRYVGLGWAKLNWGVVGMGEWAEGIIGEEVMASGIRDAFWEYYGEEWEVSVYHRLPFQGVLRVYRRGREERTDWNEEQWMW